ncbi:MAG: hypothetical protein ACM31J_07040 [Nitrososphaerales archaeon]
MEKIDKNILETYNPDHLIPFLLIDGQFMQFGTGINPESLEKLNDEEIRKMISDENSMVWQIYYKREQHYSISNMQKHWQYTRKYQR